jgi:hypothetical protein
MAYQGFQGFPSAEELERKRIETPNLTRALVFGLIAGAIGGGLWFGIVWATNRELGLVAIAIGFLVGQAVVIGSGRKLGRRLQVLSLVLTLGAMVLAEYLIVRQAAIGYILEDYGREAADSVPLLLPLHVSWDFIVSGVQDDPAQLLFWGIALWTAFRIPAPRRLVPAPAPAATPIA